LTNDDVYRAGGIQALRAELSTWADVVLMAPETEQSATSHSLSIHRPLRFRQVSEGQFSLDGTPADCVYVALHAIGRVLPRRPDMVVSGLNHGVNLGADVFYSGTVGGAREGALRRIPALAASADGRTDRPAAARYASNVAQQLLALLRRQETGRPLLFNLNIPPGEGPWPLRRTVLGSRLYVEEVTFAKGPRGLEFLWIGGAPKAHEQIDGSDTDAFDTGYASITPLVLDLSSASDAPLADDLVAAVAAQETP
jgi:5'-nucleotidase